VEKIEVTVEQQSEHVLRHLHKRGKSSFHQICMELNTRTEIVVTFLAILEMLKEKQINLYIKNENPTDFYLDLKPVDEIIGSRSTEAEENAFNKES